MRIKREFTGNFYLMSNSSAQDPRLSLAARGLLNTLMSFPPDFNVHATTLCGYCADGKDAVYSAMRKLIRAGYVYKTGLRERTAYHADALPHTEEEWRSLLGGKNPEAFTENPQSLCGNSSKPIAENPQSPLRKSRNDLCGNSGNNKTNNKTKEKEREAGFEKKPDKPIGAAKSGEPPVEAAAPESQGSGGYNVPLSFAYNASQKDITARLNAVSKAWNESGVPLPCRKIFFTPPEITNMLPTLQCYSDSQIQEAVRNYAAACKEPAAYRVKEDGTGITLVN